MANNSFSERRSYSQGSRRVEVKASLTEKDAGNIGVSENKIHLHPLLKG